MTGRTRAAALAVGALTLLLCLSSDALAGPAGSLTQIGCLSSVAVGGCTPVSGLGSENVAGRPAFAPDGKTLYVPSNLDDTLDVFTRAANGSLTRTACVSKTGGGGCAPLALLDNPNAVAVAPDGAFVYVTATNGAADGKLLVFPRTSGGLGVPACFSAQPALGCSSTAALANLGGASAVFARNDSVYVTTGSSVYAFRRAAAAHDPAGCVGPSAPCTSDNGRFDVPTDVVVAPDGKHAYVSSYNFPDRLVGLDRTSNGTLIARNDKASCVSYDTLATCQKRLAGRETLGIALSPDGKQLYATSRYQYGGGEAVELFDLPGDGTIKLHPGGCWASSSAAALPGCTPTLGLENNYDVTLAPDGLSAYVASLDGDNNTSSTDDGWIVAFARGADGMLAPRGCFATVLRTGCTTLTGGAAMSNVVVSPDSRHLYTTGIVGGGGGDTRLLTFRIEHAPTCAPVSAATAFNTPVQLRLKCGDIDGDPLSYSVVTPPGRGSLGGIQADGSVFYSPLNGLSGPDSFTFRATSGGLASAPATASLDVGGPPPPPPGGGGPPAPLVRVDVPVRPFWARYPRYLQLRRMRVTKLPANATVEIRCKGRGCPFAKRTVKISDGKANAAKGFRHAKLRRGTTVQIRILVPGMIGKVVVYTMPKKGFPVGRQRCLPPGATTPSKC
jgi:DNA-binding beta-propeller fold protein YncE